MRMMSNNTFILCSHALPKLMTFVAICIICFDRALIPTVTTCSSQVFDMSKILQVAVKLTTTLCILSTSMSLLSHQCHSVIDSLHFLQFKGWVTGTLAAGLKLGRTPKLSSFQNTVTKIHILTTKLISVVKCTGSANENYMRVLKIC